MALMFGDSPVVFWPKDILCCVQSLKEHQSQAAICSFHVTAIRVDMCCFSEVLCPMHSRGSGCLFHKELTFVATVTCVFIV